MYASVGLGSASVLLSISPVSATTYYGYLSAHEDGNLLAEASGGDIHYNGSHGPTMDMRFRDRRADGDGAYERADFQAWDQLCPPRNICYYTWAWVREKQTDRYGTASGWLSTYVGTTEEGISRWRGRPFICVDQSWEPDACGKTDNYLEP